MALLSGFGLGVWAPPFLLSIPLLLPTQRSCWQKAQRLEVRTATTAATSTTPYNIVTTKIHKKWFFFSPFGLERKGACA